MMDLSALDLGDTAARRPDVSALLDFAPVREDGTPFTNGGGEPLRITFRDPGTLEGKRELLKLDVLYPEPAYADPARPTEEEAGQAAENRMARNREMFLRMVAGWNIVNGAGGEPVPFTIPNALAIMEQAPSVAAAIAARGVEILAEVGNGRRPSASGPNRTDGAARQPSPRPRAGRAA